MSKLIQEKVAKTMTDIQKIVVDRKIKDGYQKIGVAKSISVSGDVVLLLKGKHTIAINCLGYDEHTGNNTWGVYE